MAIGRAGGLHKLHQDLLRADAHGFLSFFCCESRRPADCFSRLFAFSPPAWRPARPSEGRHPAPLARTFWAGAAAASAALPAAACLRARSVIGWCGGCVRRLTGRDLLARMFCYCPARWLRPPPYRARPACAHVLPVMEQ